MTQQISASAKQLWTAIAVFILSSLMSIQSYGQDKKIDVNVNTKPDNGNNFFMQPWVWIVGAAVFILLLVALTSGGSRDRSDRVVVKKTVRETDV